MDTGFSGNLNSVAFEDILQLISTGKKTGMLQVQSNHQKKHIYFSKGDITYATSVNNEGELLGQILLKRKKISPTDLERAINLQKLSGKKIGRTLIEMRLLKEEDITQALKLQIEEIVYNLFAWNQGEFSFVKGKLPPPDQITTNLDTMNVIMEGTRRIDEWIQIKKVLPPGDMCLRVNLDPKPEMGVIKLTPSEYRALMLAKENKTLPEIIDKSPDGEFVTSKAVYNLLSSSLVELGEKKRIREQKKAEEKILISTICVLYSRSYSLLDHVLEKKIGTGKSRLFAKIWANHNKSFPLFPKLFPKDSPITLESFLETASRIPKEIRFHSLMEMLNALLNAKLKLISDLLGRNIFRHTVSEIKKDIAPLIAEQREVVGKYWLEENMMRALKTLE